MNIMFDKSAKKDILGLLGKEIDQESFIIEKTNPRQRVLSFDGEEVTLEDFGGVKKGSEVFIKKDIISLMRFSKE